MTRRFKRRSLLTFPKSFLCGFAFVSVCPDANEPTRSRPLLCLQQTFLSQDALDNTPT